MDKPRLKAKWFISKCTRPQIPCQQMRLRVYRKDVLSGLTRQLMDFSPIYFPSICFNHARPLLLSDPARILSCDPVDRDSYPVGLSHNLIPQSDPPKTAEDSFSFWCVQTWQRSLAEGNRTFQPGTWFSWIHPIDSRWHRGAKRCCGASRTHACEW